MCNSKHCPHKHFNYQAPNTQHSGSVLRAYFENLKNSQDDEEQTKGSGEPLGNRGDNVRFSDEEIAQKVRKYSRHDTSHVILENAEKSFYDKLELKRPKKKPKRLTDGTGYKNRPAIFLCSLFTNVEAVGDEVVERQGILDQAHVIRDPDGNVRFSGLVLCNNPACPICAILRSAKIRETAINVGAAVRDLGGHVSFLTLTVQHYKRDKLEDLSELLHRATRELFKNDRFRRETSRILGLFDGFKSVPTFKILEVLYGKHGWHPHHHIAFYHTNKVSEDQMNELRALIQSMFEKQLIKIRKKMGLEQREINDKATHFIQVNDDEIEEVTGDYCTKEGVSGGFEFELTGGIYKNETGDLNSDKSLDEEWFESLKDKVKERLSKGGVTFIVLLDIAEHYKKIYDNATDATVKRRAKEKYEEYSALYREYVLMTFGNRNLNRFSKGLKGLCGIVEEESEVMLEDEPEIEEEIVSKIDVPIPDKTWNYIFAEKLRVPLLKVVSVPEIEQNDVEQVISVIGRALSNRRQINEVKSWLGRIYYERSYQKFGRYEEDLTIQEYEKLLEKRENSRIEREQAEIEFEKQEEKIKFVQKYLSDKKKRLTARPVFYDFKGSTLFVSDIERIFKREIDICQNL